MAVAAQTPGKSTMDQAWFVPVLVILGMIVAIILSWMMPAQTEVPSAITDSFPIIDWVNAAEQWLRANYQAATRKVARFIAGWVEWLEFWLLFKPWLFVVLLFALPALAYGGLRLAIFTVFGVVVWGMFDMWDTAMTTLALMGISVLMSVVIGVMIGVLCSQSDGIERAVRPVLDTMQTMPAFVYLIPAIFFFGIGSAPATLATMIYAMPPMVRLTNLGIRQVPETTMEAARSFGSTRLQTLLKVQLPQALPSIMLGINQTVMMALGLVVLATFIGAGGLGDEVWKALTKLRVGWALEGGLCIVFMAIMFDRLSYAMSGNAPRLVLGPNQLRFRLLPQSWDANGAAIAIERGVNAVWQGVAALGNGIVGGLAAGLDKLISVASRDLGARVAAFMNAHVFLILGLAVLFAVLYINDHVWEIGDFPDAWKHTIRPPVDDAVNWLTVQPTFIAVTKSMKIYTVIYFLNPLVKFLTHLPWWFTTAVFALVAWRSVGWGFALATVLGLFFVAAGGFWIFAMETLATISVCLLVCILIGVPLGVLAAYNKTFDAIMRPILDTMQTMPTFVYLIPVLLFFGGGIFAGVIATVIYAVPPVIRLTTLGIRQLPHEIDEVSNSFGSTPTQSLFKVKLPMATPSIMLGLNQAVMMALAMQVVTPIIGGRGLGHQVYDAMNIADAGKGVVSGTGIVLLAIILDRLSQAWTRTQRKALGLD